MAHDLGCQEGLQWVNGVLYFCLLRSHESHVILLLPSPTPLRGRRGAVVAVGSCGVEL